MRDVIDGTSNTIFMGEHIAANFGVRNSVAGDRVIVSTAMNWNDNIPGSCLALTNGDKWIVGTQIKARMGTAMWDGQAERVGMTTIIPPNGPSCSNGTNVNADSTDPMITPSSFHTGGVQVLMGDGAVRFISENIDSGDLTVATPGNNSTGSSPYGVWGALGTRAGGEVVGEF